MGVFKRDWRNDRVASLNSAAHTAGDEFWSQTAARVLGRKLGPDGMMKGSITDEEAQRVIAEVRAGRGRRRG